VEKLDGLAERDRVCRVFGGERGRAFQDRSRFQKGYLRAELAIEFVNSGQHGSHSATNRLFLPTGVFDDAPPLLIAPNRPGDISPSPLA